MDFYLNIRNSSYKQRKHLKGYMSYFSYGMKLLFVSVFAILVFNTEVVFVLFSEVQSNFFRKVTPKANNSI